MLVRFGRMRLTALRVEAIAPAVDPLEFFSLIATGHWIFLIIFHAPLGRHEVALGLAKGVHV